METKEIEAKVCDMVSRIGNVDIATLDADTDIVGSLGFSSMQMYSVAAMLESITGAHVVLADLNDLKTIRDFTEFAASKMA